MKTPVRYSRGRLRYTGRVAPERFALWAESPSGRAALEHIASGMRFRPFGKMRAARRRVWKQVLAAARAEEAMTALQREVDDCLTRLGTLVYAQGLPRVSIELHRLVAVPRSFVNAEAYRHLDAAMRRLPVFASLEAGPSLRDWLILAIIEAIDASVSRAGLSPSRPMPAGSGWVTIGIDQQVEWRVTVDGPAWPGHYYVLELPRTGVSRAFRKRASEAMSRMNASLPSLSRDQRNSVLSQAGASLEQLLRSA